MCAFVVLGLFFHTKPGDWLEEMSPKMCQVRHNTTNQSISRNLCILLGIDRNCSHPS